MSLGLKSRSFIPLAPNRQYTPIYFHDPRLTTNYPTIASDPDVSSEDPDQIFDSKIPLTALMQAWPAFLQAQQVITSSIQFVIDLNQAIPTGSTMSYVYERM